MHPHAHRFAGAIVLAAAGLAGPATLSAGASGGCEGADPVTAGARDATACAARSGGPRAAISRERIAGRVMRVSRHADSFGHQVDLLAPAATNRFRSAHGTPDASLAALPARWCGTERSTDDRRHAVSDAPQVKVAYAYPRGAPNRFALYKDLIQQDVAAARALVASASGGRRTIRFDMGTDCPGGARYVDIQSVALPHPASHYGFDAVFASRLLTADLERLLHLRGVRNVTTYVDGVTPGSTTGVASQPLDEARGAGNEANRGGQRAFVFGDGSPQFAFNRTRAFLHETTHNLGAVQDAAPHATGAGHCFDGEDVMCYDDGGPSAPAIDAAPACPGRARFDCGTNDYFAAAPAPRTYLARHWNLFDSDFMCAISSCGARATGEASTGSIRSALRLTLRALTVSLRRRGLPALAQRRAVRVAFRAPGPGTLRLDLATGRQRLAAGSRSFRRGGRRMLRVRFGREGRRLAGASRLRMAVRLSFTAKARGRTRRSSVLVLRRR